MIIQPRPFNLRKTLTALAVIGVAFYFYYQRPPPLQFWRMSGATMGTTYSIKVLDQRLTQVDVQRLKQEIDAHLAEINRQMSTYLPDSEISRFNQHQDTTPFSVSPGFAGVMRLAVEVCRDTDGAFNPGLDPLINAWGFGPSGPGATPDEAILERALALAGCDAVSVTPDGALVKQHPRSTANLNAIAKGWGVDEVARLIEKAGVTNYFVEIGGEVFARGISEKIRPWRVGIDRPADGALPGEAYDLVVALDGVALATSGNYRNFFTTDDGINVAHILDPRTGRPVLSSTASVSVIAPTCMLADALATAFFVMGSDEGLAWVERHEGVEAAFTEYGADGELVTRLSPGFSSFVVSP
ncbi:MAG TPA: FAD:protein FMN transferase [Kiritimatiellia bacterium]|nr:FAD:protein FMN transferase [Kiritimatiellia bacterium]HMO98059.1 FAD:protein FMN transferase [Kiritimatiellia bacterium]HMP97005.1 FAD:protein FMN transferase [Kiritimatiellia bacterium]